MNLPVKLLSSFVVAAVVNGVSSIALGLPPSVMTFDVPGAADTAAYGINDAGQIVGTFNDKDAEFIYQRYLDFPYCEGCQHGFLYSKGKFTTINVPGAKDTSAVGLSNAGDIVGTYTDALGLGHGFIYASGKFNTIPFYPRGLNNAGKIVGADVVYDHGNVTALHLPGDPDFPDLNTTTASGINDTGDLVGAISLDPNSSYYYTDCGDDRAPCEAFSYINGRFRILEDAKVALGINNAGDIVGYTGFSGFLYSHGKLTRIDQFPEDINNVGQVVGWSITGGDGRDAHLHAFLLTIPEPSLLALLIGSVCVFVGRYKLQATAK